MPVPPNTEKGVIYCRFIPTHPDTVEEIEQHPGDDDVVVERHKQRDNTAGDADTAQPGVDGVPHAQGAQSHLLPDGHLDEEEWDALQDQHDEVGDQEGAWGRT